MGPQTGFTGSAFSMPLKVVGGRFAQNGPQDRGNPFFGVFGPFRVPGGREISFSPPDPQKSSKLQIATARGRTSKVQNVRNLRNANAVLMGQKSPEKSPVAPSYGRNGALPEPGFEPGTSPSLGRGPPKKPVNCEFPGGNGQHHSTSSE